MEWYLVQSKANSHSMASENLKRQNLEVFVPLILKTLKLSGKFVTQKKPLFPNYFFIGFRSEKPTWKSINSTKGVHKAVTFDGTYRPVSNKIIKGLQIRCDAEGVLKPDLEIMPGELVKIETGPFSDFVCKVEKIDSEKRVWVLLQLMQQKTRARISVGNFSRSN